MINFRAFDGIGAITMLSIVRLIVNSLPRRFRPALESANRPDQQQATSQQALDDNLTVPSVVMQ